MMADVDYENIWRRIRSRSSAPDGPYGCVMWRGAKEHRGVYGVMVNPFALLAGQPRKVSIHRLVYVLHHRERFPGGVLPTRDPDGRRLQVSHVCHRGLCINPAHLVLESQRLNNERSTCRRQRRCLQVHQPHCLL